MFDNKPYKLNPSLNFDEQLLHDFSKQSGITLVRPKGALSLSIRLKEKQLPCVEDIGYPSVICQHILQDYMKEHHDDYLKKTLETLKIYSCFINIEFRDYRKTSISITLLENFTSINDIASVRFGYNIYLKDKRVYCAGSEVRIVFNGDSSYEIINDNSANAEIKMIINYHDFDSFILKFIEFHRNKFARRLGVKRSTDVHDMKALVDMMLI